MGTTAAALLDAAESAFAEAGIEEASLRRIMRDAGADSGAVHYHFGTREQLACAVLDRILVPLNARRLELLARAEKGDSGRGIELAALVEALIRPDIEAAWDLDGRSEGRARLIGAIYIRPAAFVEARVEEHFRPVAEAFLPHLARAVPGVDRDGISWRVRWCLFGTLGALLSHDRAPFETHAEVLIERLVTAITASIAASPVGA